ncbi:MAG: TrmH family RNA methyltransferase [Halanaerobiaceae bacterium]
MEIITSEKNQKIKELKKLYRSKWRRKTGRYVLEGVRLIRAALKAGAVFDRVFVTPELAAEEDLPGRLQSRTGIDVIYVAQQLIENISDTVSPQGITAIVADPDYTREDITETGPVLVLDRIQDPGNMGTLIRTAAAAGYAGIICLKGCVDIYNLKVLRATMGAIFQLPVVTGEELNSFLAQMLPDERRLICCDLAGEKYYHQLSYTFPHMLVIGNEARGICNSILEVADEIVKIPLYGEVESLNAAVAGGIVIYESAVNYYSS